MLATRAILGDEGRMGASPGTSAATEPSRHGLRALVTRPRAEAEELVNELAGRGIAAIVEPLLDIRYRAEAAPEFAGVQAVLCTSANGVRALARLTPERAVPLLAVGEASAARARAEGFAEVASAGGNVDDLVRLTAARLRPHAGRLLHVAGSVAAGDLAGALRQRGFAVERTVLYEASPAQALSAATARALAAGTIDFVLLFSPRTAAVFARLVGQSGLAPAMRFMTALSISAAADAVVEALSFRDRYIAERPDQAHLLAALDSLLARRGSA
jgi:uroporphyrinogen-III synthase